MKIRNPDFKPFGFTVGQVKTWAALVLGRNLQADQGMGVPRKYSLEEAFKIYVCGQLVSKSGMGLKEAKELLNNLWPILERHKLVSLNYVTNGDIPNIRIELLQDMLGTISIDLGEDTQPGENGWLIKTKMSSDLQFILKGGTLFINGTFRVIDLHACIEDFLQTLGLLQS